MDAKGLYRRFGLASKFEHMRKMLKDFEGMKAEQRSATFSR